MSWILGVRVLFCLNAAVLWVCCSCKDQKRMLAPLECSYKCERPHGFCESDPGRLEEQKALSTAESSLSANKCRLQTCVPPGLAEGHKAVHRRKRWENVEVQWVFLYLFYPHSSPFSQFQTLTSTVIKITLIPVLNSFA